MAAIYLFTWNLNEKMEAHDLAVEHLSLCGERQLFIACFQELPGKSAIARARKAKEASLTARQIEVIATPAFSENAAKTSCPRGLALAYHSDLSVVSAVPDQDGEFWAAVLRLPSSRKTIGVIGLHAKSKSDMQHAEDWGGSRALLRQAINDLRLECDHTVLLGDWNSHLSARELKSWHCFYALSGTSRPLTGKSSARRRGQDHRPFYIVRPDNADGMRTFSFRDSGSDDDNVIDFIAVDEGSLPGSTSSILTSLNSTVVWDAASARPNLSDHLPVQGALQI